MRTLPFLFCLPALLATAADVPPAHHDPRAPIRAAAIPLDRDAPWRTRVGRLAYVAGWVLDGSHPRFGGLSAMTIDRGRLTALSDTGFVIGFTLGPRGPANASIRPLPVLGGAADKRARDVEAMARDPATGTIWIAVENSNAIWRYAPGFARAQAKARPRTMRRWWENGGAETMVRLADGRFLVIAEKKHAGGGTREALLFAGDPTRAQVPRRMRYRPSASCDPTDAALLPDARVVVLERCVSMARGLAAVLRIVDPRAIAGGVLGGQEIARLARPAAIDNMEALAVTRERGGTMIWIASDDNLNILQRTLLLKFRLVE